MRGVGRGEGEEAARGAKLRDVYRRLAPAGGLAARLWGDARGHGIDGVYWKPVWHVLEGQFQLLLVNAQHVKAIPGRKTDRGDAARLAELLQHGLLRSSFVPPPPIRELRDLTRYRVSLAQECNRIANRIQKVLEDANLKLASVATNPL